MFLKFLVDHSEGIWLLLSRVENLDGMEHCTT